MNISDLILPNVNLSTIEQMPWSLFHVDLWNEYINNIVHANQIKLSGAIDVIVYGGDDREVTEASMRYVENELYWSLVKHHLTNHSIRRTKHNTNFSITVDHLLTIEFACGVKTPTNHIPNYHPHTDIVYLIDGEAPRNICVKKLTNHYGVSLSEIEQVIF